VDNYNDDDDDDDDDDSYDDDDNNNDDHDDGDDDDNNMHAFVVCFANMIISGCDRGTRGSSGVSVTRSYAVDDDKRGDKR